jgi:hypothetical protein
LNDSDFTEKQNQEFRINISTFCKGVSPQPSIPAKSSSKMPDSGLAIKHHYFLFMMVYSMSLTLA